MKGRDSNMIPAVRPASMAREVLGEALGQVQDIRDAPLDVQEVTALIAKAVSELYRVETSKPDDPSHVAGVKAAMGSMSSCLELLQEVSIRSPALDAATGAMARCLAILYPVSKAQDKGLPAAQRGDPTPLPSDARRSNQRVALNVDLGFQSETHFYTGFTQDVSQGGLFVATYDLLDMGTGMALSFTLPDGHLVSCFGAVRWLREYNPAAPEVVPGMGVQFAKLEAVDRVAIDRYLAKRPAIFYED